MYVKVLNEVTDKKSPYKKNSIIPLNKDTAIITHNLSREDYLTPTLAEGRPLNKFTVFSSPISNEARFMTFGLSTFINIRFAMFDDISEIPKQGWITLEHIKTAKENVHAIANMYAHPSMFGHIIIKCNKEGDVPKELAPIEELYHSMEKTLR